MNWHIRDIKKLERFLTKYFARETSAPINDENAIDVAILFLQKYHLTSRSNGSHKERAR